MEKIYISGVYNHPLERIHTIEKFFETQKDGSIIFTGSSLEARVPIRYRQYGLLEVSQNIETFGLMELIINDKYLATLNIAAKLVMCPSESEESTIDDTPYLVMKFSEGDTFILTQDVLQNSGIIYCIYVEYMTRGHRLPSVTYDDMAKLFDHCKELTGRGVDRLVMEFMIAHLGRNPKDLHQQWRYTSLKEDPVIIFLRSINLSPTSTTTRLMGSYGEDGLTSSLNTVVKQRQPFEDLLRGLPSES